MLPESHLVPLEPYLTFKRVLKRLQMKGGTFIWKMDGFPTFDSATKGKV